MEPTPVITGLCPACAVPGIRRRENESTAPDSITIVCYKCHHIYPNSQDDAWAMYYESTGVIPPITDETNPADIISAESVARCEEILRRTQELTISRSATEDRKAIVLAEARIKTAVCEAVNNPKDVDPSLPGCMGWGWGTVKPFLGYWETQRARLKAEENQEFSDDEAYQRAIFQQVGERLWREEMEKQTRYQSEKTKIKQKTTKPPTT